MRRVSFFKTTMFTYKCQMFLHMQEEATYNEITFEDKTFYDENVKDEVQIPIAKYDFNTGMLIAMDVAPKVEGKGFYPYPVWQGVKDGETTTLKTHKKPYDSIKVNDYDEIIYTPESLISTKWKFELHVEERQVFEMEQIKIEDKKPEIQYILDSDDEEPVNEREKHPNMVLSEKKAEAVRKAVEAEATRKAVEAEAARKALEEANAQALLDAAEEAKKKELEEQAAKEAAALLEQMKEDKRITEEAMNKFMISYAEIVSLEEQKETKKMKYFQDTFDIIDTMPKAEIPDPVSVVPVGKKQQINTFDVFKSRPENSELYMKLYRMANFMNKVEGKGTRNMQDDVKRAFTWYCNKNPDKKKQFEDDLK